MTETAQVFVLMFDAVAGEGCEVPAGEARHLLVMAPAASAEEAAAGAMEALAGRGWSQVRLKDADQFRSEPRSLGDPVLRAAAEKAFAGSRAIVVYDKP